MTDSIRDALGRQRAACDDIRAAANIRDVAARQDAIVDGCLVIGMAAREIELTLPVALGAAARLRREASARKGGKPKVRR